jgi:hypothetical protein
VTGLPRPRELPRLNTAYDDGDRTEPGGAQPDDQVAALAIRERNAAEAAFVEERLGHGRGMSVTTAMILPRRP